MSTITNRTFYNFSTDRKLSDNVLLSLNLKFCPRPPDTTDKVVFQEIKTLARRLHIHEHFRQLPMQPNDGYDARLVPRPKASTLWRPDAHPAVLEFHAKLADFAASVLRAAPLCRTLPDKTAQRLIHLQHRGDIIFTASDKNLGITALDTTHYHKLVMEHLSNTLVYCKIAQSDWPNTLTRLHQQHRSLWAQLAAMPAMPYHLTYLRQPLTMLPKFHILPKIHKTGQLKGRPIVGAPAWYTTKWAKWLSLRLQQLSQPWRITNSTQLVQTLENMHVDDNTILFTMDVESLYTMMHADRLISIIKQSTNNDMLLVNVLEFICANNYFTYNDQIYQQVDGIAMGSNASVELADLYLTFGFDDIINTGRATGQHSFTVKTWRYIDDVFGMFTGTLDQFHTFTAWCNQLIDNIRLTAVTSTHSVPFLDLTIYIANNTLAVRPFQKPMNTYLYLPHFSCHPPHTFASFVTAELKRFVRNSTTAEDFVAIRTAFRQRLRHRGYDKYWLDKVFAHITHSDRARLLQPPSPPSTPLRIMPFVLPFSRRSAVTQIARHAQTLNTLVPTTRIVTAWRRPPNIATLLCRSSLSKAQQRALADAGVC